MVTSVFGLATWVFVSIVISLLLVIFLATDKEEGATVSMLGGVVLLYFVTKGAFLIWIRDHIGTFLLLLLGYFVAGVIWSFIKWYFYLLNVRDEVRAAGSIEKWQKDNPWKASYGQTWKVPPDPAQHKGRIIGWMTYWPWSALWTLINDPIRRIWKIIYSRVAGVFKSVSDSVFRSEAR
jgi:hypothetical protein